MTISPHRIPNGWYDVMPGSRPGPRAVQSLPDLRSALPAGTLGRVGGVPVGCEETELCIRLQQRYPDGLVLYEPAARVRHHVSTDRWTWGYFRNRCFSEGRSKAVVARLVGPDVGLSAERHYSRRVLPRGVRRGLLEVGAGRDLGGLTRSAAIVVGLLMTVTGYLSCRMSMGGRGASMGNSTMQPADLDQQDTLT